MNQEFSSGSPKPTPNRSPRSAAQLEHSKHLADGVDKSAAGKKGAEALWVKRRADEEYRNQKKQQAIAEAGDEFCGDPVTAITGLLLLLTSHRLRTFARDNIRELVEEMMEPLYSNNRSLVERERFIRLQELYSRNSVGSARQNGFSMI
jgi:hypothetical protein